MSKDRLVISWLAVLCILYAVFHLSPSSYGYVLQQLGFDNPGLLLGSPIPIRGDEHSVVTPTFQVCVNNHFERFNTTSPYGEDLRTNLSFPLKDWGLLFKPYFAVFLLNCVDFSKRIANLGLKRIFLPNYYYVHFVGFSKAKNPMLIKGYEIYISKHFSGVDKLLVTIALKINKLVKSIKKAFKID